MLTDKDLEVIQYDVAVFCIIKSIRIKALCKTIQSWFNVPELRPQGEDTTLEDYSFNSEMRNKTDIIERMVRTDWKDGLHAIQIADLAVRSMFDTTKRTKWKVIKMGKVNGTIDLNLSIDTIRHKLEMFLNRIFHTYVYGFHHKQTNGYWFRVCCYKNNEAHKLPPASHRGFLVYYPQTNYLVIQSYWLKEIMTYLNEAILHVFSADKLTITKITCNKLDEMSDVILNRNSLGVFSQLRNNQVDANPLDIRQKKPEGHDQTYVKTAEQRRRIVPIDPEQMKARYDMLSDHFGWDTIRSSGALDIDLLLPLHTGPETVSNADEELHIEIQMKGTSVMEGVRKMLLNGQIEASPGWVAGAATSGATKIYISKEGISSAIDTDDEENGENEVPAEVMTG